MSPDFERVQLRCTASLAAGQALLNTFSYWHARHVSTAVEIPRAHNAPLPRGHIGVGHVIEVPYGGIRDKSRWPRRLARPEFSIRNRSEPATRPDFGT